METKTKIGVGIAGLIIGGAGVFTLLGGGQNVQADSVCTKDVNGEVTCTTEVVSKQDYIEIQEQLDVLTKYKNTTEELCASQIARSESEIADLKAVIDQVK